MKIKSKEINAILFLVSSNTTCFPVQQITKTLMKMDKKYYRSKIKDIELGLKKDKTARARGQTLREG